LLGNTCVYSAMLETHAGGSSKVASLLPSARSNHNDEERMEDGFNAARMVENYGDEEP